MYFLMYYSPAILKAGYHCIPKHDSYINNRHDQNNITIIRDIELSKINYKCKFKDNFNQPCLYVAQCLRDDKAAVPPITISKGNHTPHASQAIIPDNKRGYHLPSDEQLGIKPLNQRLRQKNNF